MGYNVTKRVSALRKQVDEGSAGRWGFVRILFLSILTFSVLAFIISPAPESSLDEEHEISAETEAVQWNVTVRKQFNERVVWLENFTLLDLLGCHSLYKHYGLLVLRSINTKYRGEKQDENGISGLFGGVSFGLLGSRLATNAFLKLGFVVIAFWPFWALAAGCGYLIVHSPWLTPISFTILGVLDRKRSPFYSGIYGPLRPNGSFSGTDLSCPGLACPAMVDVKVAQTHTLTQTLKKYNAFNNTNLSLVQVILAHADYPAVVQEEAPPQQDELELEEQPEDKISATGFVSNELGTVEQSSLAGLSAVLEAHDKIIRYVKSLEEKGYKSSVLNKNYPSHLSHLEKVTANLNPLAKMIAMSLTPNRMWALGHLPATVIATAYLATEAGKSLVFKRHAGAGFTRISRYPNLQARAVVQAQGPYHQEYNGDIRLMVRQAIICSQRHGDFGRAFLPNRMPIESRAMRDLLEILYAEPAIRGEIGALVELDAHMEEIHVNWRTVFGGRVRQQEKENRGNEESSSPFWKGIVFKSVVLTPLNEVVEQALKGIHPVRLSRIAELLESTSKLQAKISISARLPGFKRQALEADVTAEETDDIIQSLIRKGPEAKALIHRWRIVRRMLTRYNWLSTRVGDDAVSILGVVQGLVHPHSEDEGAGAVMASFDSLVPLRQRRFVELLGRQWEPTFYKDSPHPGDIEISVTNEEFVESLKQNGGSTDSGASEKLSSVGSG